MHRTTPSIEKPLFIIGVPRSGTTLVADLISHHEDLAWFSNHFANHPRLPQLSFLNRLTDIPGIGHYLRGKERRGRKGRFKAKLPYPREAYSVWDSYCRVSFSKDYLIDVKATKAERKQIRRVIRSVLKFHGKPRFFNKMTGPARISYLSSIFPDARYLHIVRDPRAVVSSLLNVRFWRQNGGFEKPWWRNGLKESQIEAWENSGRNPAVLAAIQWRQIIEHARYEASKSVSTKNCYLEIEYENFVNDPKTVTKRILSFSLLKNSKRIDKMLEQMSIKINMNNKYLSHLSKNDISAIGEITRSITF